MPLCATISSKACTAKNFLGADAACSLMPILMAWRRLCRTMWPFCVVCLATLLIVLLSRQDAQTGSDPITASPLKRGNQLY